MIQGFLTWWGRELASLVPGFVKHLFLPTPPALVAVNGPEGIDLSLHTRRSKQIGRLGSIPSRTLKRLKTALRRRNAVMYLALSGDQVLRQTVTLPLAAEADLQSVMRFEIDRLTPFSADEIYYAFQVTGRDTVAATLSLDLAFVPRDQVATETGLLSETGLSPERLDVLDNDGRLSGFNLFPKESSRTWSWSARIAALLAFSSLLLAGTTAAMTLLQREAEVEALRSSVNEARRAAIARQDRLAAASRASDPLTVAIYREKRQSPSALEVLAAVTDVLPDHTYLEVFDLEGTEIRLTGQSDDSSGLIARLDRHPLLADPAFASPMTRDQESGKERFTLTLQVSVQEGGQ